MKSITLENPDLVADLFEEAWTVEGAIAIYPYKDNRIELLTKHDLKHDDLINSIYANENVALFDTACFEEVVGFQNLIRDMFKQEIYYTNKEIFESGKSLELAEKLNRYKNIYTMLGGKK